MVGVVQTPTSCTLHPASIRPVDKAVLMIGVEIRTSPPITMVLSEPKKVPNARPIFRAVSEENCSGNFPRMS